jgi:hypothetical protein
MTLVFIGCRSVKVLPQSRVLPRAELLLKNPQDPQFNKKKIRCAARTPRRQIGSRQ